MPRRSLCAVVLGLSLFAHTPANAAIIKQIRIGDMQAANGLAVVRLPKGHTVNLSFIKSGEVIRQVRIDDRRQVVVSFDSLLCPHTNRAGVRRGGCQSGASIIYLRQLADAVKFSRNQSAAYRADGYRATALTVVTTTARGQRKIYNFELRLIAGSTAPRTIEMVRGGGAIASGLIRPYAAVPVTNSTRQSLPATQRNRVHLIRQGLAQAYARNLVALDSPVRLAMQRFMQAINAGKSLEAAQAESEIPQEFLGWLQTLATS